MFEHELVGTLCGGVIFGWNDIVNNHDDRGMRQHNPHSWSHRSRSCDPTRSSQQNSFSSNHQSFQRNSFHSRIVLSSSMVLLQQAKASKEKRETEVLNDGICIGWQLAGLDRH